jgi:hypothetical protein
MNKLFISKGSILLVNFDRFTNAGLNPFPDLSNFMRPTAKPGGCHILIKKTKNPGGDMLRLRTMIIAVAFLIAAYGSPSC